MDLIPSLRRRRSRLSLRWSLIQFLLIVRVGRTSQHQHYDTSSNGQVHVNATAAPRFAYCHPASSSSSDPTERWHRLHSEALQLDALARALTSDLSGRILQTSTAVVEHIRRRNVGWYGAAATTTAGRILTHYSDSADMASFTYAGIVNVAGLSFVNAGFGAYALYFVEDDDLKCGLHQYRRAVADHSRLFRLEDLYQGMQESELADIHPRLLSLEADELGHDLKSGLGCLVRSDFEKGDAIVVEVDKIVLTLKARLEITEQLITFQ